jgi:hypothetical protein
MKDTLVFDIETWPETDDVLGNFADPTPTRTAFDPASVKTGNLKDAEKIAQKIEECRIAHEAEQEEKCDPSKALNKVKEKACLKGHLGRLYAFGARDDGFVLEFGQVPAPTREQESVLLERLLGIMGNHISNVGPGAKIAGWNTEGFDIPFIIQRAILLGVKIPFTVRTPIYYTEWSVDLMTRWSMGRDFVGLGTVAKAMGLGGKQDLSGKLPWEICVTSPDRAMEYLRRDIELTWKVGCRMMSAF